MVKCKIAFVVYCVAVELFATKLVVLNFN